MIDKVLSNIGEQLIAHARAGIKAVLDGEVEEYQNDYLSPEKYAEILEELGAEQEQGWETNGWDWEYWIYYRYQGKRFFHNGSGYYGQVSFERCKDEK